MSLREEIEDIKSRIGELIKQTYDNAFERGCRYGMKIAWEVAKEFNEDILNPDITQQELLEKYNIPDIKWGESISKAFFDRVDPDEVSRRLASLEK